MDNKHYSPTNEKSRLKKLWEYFWNLENLYDKKTNTAYCVYTGSRITMRETTQRRIPLYAFHYSLGTAVILMYIIKLFRENTAVLPFFYIIGTTLFGILLFLFLRRFNFADLLSRAEWTPIGNDSPTVLGPTEDLEVTAAAENRYMVQVEIRGFLLGLFVVWLFR